jgi:predicted RNase H-like HicB family nuclease
VAYRVVLIKSEEGFAVGCPALPGCWSQGETREEALANIREAIALWLEMEEEDIQHELEAGGVYYSHESVILHSPD